MADFRSVLEQQPRPLRFGDSQEFTYEGCAEEVDSAGDISELTIFFRAADGAYGLSVERTDQDSLRTSSDTDEDLLPAIETQHVDPAFVVNILRMPSETILGLAIKLPTELS